MSLPFPPVDSSFLEIVLTGCLFPESQGTVGDGTRVFGGCGRCHSSAPKKRPPGLLQEHCAVPRQDHEQHCGNRACPSHWGQYKVRV